MPRFIVKLTEGDSAWYMEWSSVPDAPVTYGMPLEEFKEYYRDEYGRSSMDELAQRLARVENTGSSSRMHTSADDIISGNRAGKNGTCLTKQQIIDHFCKIPENFDEDEHESHLPLGTKLELDDA